MLVTTKISAMVADTPTQTAARWALREFAERHGLAYRSRGHFVSPDGPLRKFLGLYPLKGTATLKWGVCFDPMPKWDLAHDKFKWCRTFKSADPFH